jgi:hypothetical protein
LGDFISWHYARAAFSLKIPKGVAGNEGFIADSKQGTESRSVTSSSPAEKKLAEIGPCANTKTTFFNTRSCKN